RRPRRAGRGWDGGPGPASKPHGGGAGVAGRRLGASREQSRPHALRCPMRLEGRKALVTGGASGIGAAISRRLAAEGAQVTIGDLNLEGAAEVAGEISGLAIELDVTDLGSAEAAVASTEPPIDILVNNAGTDEFGFFAQTTPEQWEKVIGVNLRGVLNCT